MTPTDESDIIRNWSTSLELQSLDLERNCSSSPFAADYAPHNRTSEFLHHTRLSRFVIMQANDKGFSLTTEALCSQQAFSAGQLQVLSGSGYACKTACVEVPFALAPLLNLLRGQSQARH
jgi:hypothetical protein